jgi:hypothetical protein
MQRSVILAGAVACAAVLVVHAWTFLPFMADDAFISFRYADRFLEGKGLTWTDGERVEGYSNLLWVLLVAGVSAATPLDAIEAARVLGIAAMLAAMGGLFLFAPRPHLRDATARGFSAVAFALTPAVAVWAVGGLETGLAAALLAAALVGAARRDAHVPGIALGLLCLTRPDAPLLVAGVAAGIVLAGELRREAWHLAARTCAVPVVCTLAQLGFRLAYYGDWLPNSAHAKVAFTAVRLRQGLMYLRAGVEAMPLLGLAPLAGVALLWPRARASALLLLPSFLLWMVYTGAIGADPFPAYRFLVPAVVVACFLVLVALRALPGGAATVVAGLFLAALAFFPGRHDRNVVRARLERWEWDGQKVGEFLHHAFGKERPLLAADPAGCVPYFSRLPSLDMLGLNDRFLARHPSPDLGFAMPGHELGNGPYVLSRRPDLVLFCTPLGSAVPCFRSGTELLQDAWFRQSYRLVRLETLRPDPRTSLIWVRIEGKLGVERSADRIRIPALVLAGNEPLLLRLAEDGTLRTELAGGDAVRSHPLRLEAGTWHVAVEPAGNVRLAARTPTAWNEGVASLSVTFSAAEWVELGAWAAPGGHDELGALRLTRAP